MVRAIPAWAGKTSRISRLRGVRPGHPRVGGENPGKPFERTIAAGPSPRGRGKQSPESTPPRSLRAIPAWAGKTFATGPSRPATSGHPRVGGENELKAKGKHWNAGPSPRGRGKRIPQRCGRPNLRAIPAWAGKTPLRKSCFRRGAGHPRVGGENHVTHSPSSLSSGPSPRGRGKPPRQAPHAPRCRAIPAWAGKTNQHRKRRNPPPGHPRVGGENFDLCAGGHVDDGPSPRGRGKPQPPQGREPHHRAIPAWAGKTKPIHPAASRRAGHPRVGGENTGHIPSPPPSVGPSPRGRGKPELHPIASPALRAIPAWAGKTPA